MQCPKCQADMESVTYENIEVDRCTGCKGIWFDMLEQDDLKTLEGSEWIDSGDPAVGKKMNDIGDIDCPACSEKMIKMVDRRQTHIWYEACPSCYGVFFDAGEFTDYKFETVMDLFRDLVARKRD